VYTYTIILYTYTLCIVCVKRNKGEATAANNLLSYGYTVNWRERTRLHTRVPTGAEFFLDTSEYSSSSAYQVQTFNLNSRRFSRRCLQFSEKNTAVFLEPPKLSRVVFVFCSFYADRNAMH